MAKEQGTVKIDSGWFYYRTDVVSPGAAIVAVGVDENGHPRVFMEPFRPSQNDVQFRQALARLEGDAKTELTWDDGWDDPAEVPLTEAQDDTVEDVAALEDIAEFERGVSEDEFDEFDEGPRA